MHGDQNRCTENFTGSTTPLSWPNFVTPILTRHLFAVANVFVYDCFDLDLNHFLSDFNLNHSTFSDIDSIWKSIFDDIICDFYLNKNFCDPNTAFAEVIVTTILAPFYCSIVASIKEVIFIGFVCLLAVLCKNNSTDFHKIRWKGGT